MKGENALLGLIRGTIKSEGGKYRVTEKIKVHLVLKENIGCMRVKKSEGRTD